MDLGPLKILTEKKKKRRKNKTEDGEKVVMIYQNKTAFQTALKLFSQLGHGKFEVRWVDRESGLVLSRSACRLNSFSSYWTVLSVFVCLAHKYDILVTCMKV